MVNKWTSFMPLDGFAVRLKKTAEKKLPNRNTKSKVLINHNDAHDIGINRCLLLPSTVRTLHRVLYTVSIIHRCASVLWLLCLCHAAPPTAVGGAHNLPIANATMILKRLHLYNQSGVFYFPWHRHQVEGTYDL